MNKSKRSTVYFEPDIHRALRLKAATANCSISDLVNEAVRHSFQEDQEDLTDYDRRIAEPTISYKALLEDLKANGKL